MSELHLELAPLLARRELWLLVSVGYVDPFHRKRLTLLKDPDFRRRVSTAASLVRTETPAIRLGQGEIPPSRLRTDRLFAALDSEWNRIEDFYRQLFGLTAISQCCPPCEVSYESNTDVSYRSQRLADVGGFYDAFGFAPSGQAAERIDHVTVETEFLYILLAKEAGALKGEKVEAAKVCRLARRKFFQEHAGWWLPAFARLLARTTESDYYRQLALLTAGVSTLERINLELSPLGSRVAPKPFPLQAESACFECLKGRPAE